MNKIVKFDPKKIDGKSIPEYYNQELELAYKNEKIKYITFIFNDLYDNLKDANQFINDYKVFLNDWNLPYIFFPYYAYFNKNLPNELGLPNPKLEILIKKTNTKINCVIAPTYGFLMLDITKLKTINFKFDVKYTELYYLQDLIQKCFDNKLWISNCCYIDRYNSFEDLKEINIKGYYIDSAKYNAEKAEYEKQKIQYSDINSFIKTLKEIYAL